MDWRYGFFCLMSSAALYAMPEGYQTLHGKASFSYENSKELEIHVDHQTVLQWDFFSIGKEEAVRFIFPSNKGSVLNRICSKDPTEILGKLESNGQIYLINREGIFFGEDAVINVGKLIASSFDLPEEHFFQGRDKFYTKGGSPVINMGMMSCEEEIFLIGSSIHQEGTIRAKQIHLLAKDGELLALGNLFSKETIRLEGKEILLGIENRGSFLEASSFHAIADVDIVISGNTQLFSCSEDISILCAENSLSIKGKCLIETLGELLISSNDDLKIEEGSEIRTQSGSLSLSSNEAIVIEDSTITSSDTLRIIAGGPLTLLSKTHFASIFANNDFFIEADTIQISGQLQVEKGDFQILTCDLIVYPHSSLELLGGEGVFRITVDDCGSLNLSEETCLIHHGLGPMSLVANGAINLQAGKGQCIIHSQGDIDMMADEEISIIGPSAKIHSEKGNINIYTQRDFILEQGILSTDFGNMDIYSLGSAYLIQSAINDNVPERGFFHLFAGENILLEKDAEVKIIGIDCLALFVADHNYPKSIGPGSFICRKGANISLEGSGCVRIYTTFPHCESVLFNVCHEACGVFYPTIPPYFEQPLSEVTIYYKKIP